jgi:SAM-dependent methyltransferase
MPPGSRLLDIACGAGFLAIAASLSGHETVGVDSSKHMIEEAEKCAEEAGSEAEFLMADACDLPFGDSTFGSAVIRNSLWSFFEPKKALSEACRVLAPGGSLIIIDADWIGLLDSGRPRKNDDGVRIRGGESGFGGTDIIDPIFRRLPLTGEARPDWDLEELKSLGMEVIENRPFQDGLIENYIRDIVGCPFIIVARKN